VFRSRNLREGGCQTKVTNPDGSEYEYYKENTRRAIAVSSPLCPNLHDGKQPLTTTKGCGTELFGPKVQ